jgi:hypothetical protein
MDPITFLTALAASSPVVWWSLGGDYDGEDNDGEAQQTEEQPQEHVTEPEQPDDFPVGEGLGEPRDYLDRQDKPSIDLGGEPQSGGRRTGNNGDVNRGQGGRDIDWGELPDIED